jgi:hypothetical protein
MGLRYVVKHMRAIDREEIFAMRPNDEDDALAADVMATGDLKWMLSLERPVCVWGAMPMWPGVWNVWMFATDEFPKVGLSLTKFVKNSEIPLLRRLGLHRAECKSLATHRTAHRWMEATGAVREARHSNYGRNGEAFYTYAWIF